MSPNTHKLHIARKIIRIMKFIHEFIAYIYYIPGTKNLADLFSRSPLLSSYLSNHPWILDCKNLSEIRKDPCQFTCYSMFNCPFTSSNRSYNS